MSHAIQLVNMTGPTSIHVSVKIDGGDLLFSGQDLGSGPSEFFGDSDYEYWLRVPPSIRTKSF